MYHDSLLTLPWLRLRDTQLTFPFTIIESLYGFEQVANRDTNSMPASAPLVKVLARSPVLHVGKVTGVCMWLAAPKSGCATCKNGAHEMCTWATLRVEHLSGKYVAEALSSYAYTGY